MSHVRWHYEHSDYDETSALTFYFEDENVSIVANTPCGEDVAGNDLTERFVKGDEVELPLEFVYCEPSNPPSLPEPGWPPEEFEGLRFDHDACKTAHEGSIQEHEIHPGEWAQELKDFGGADFYGTGVVRRLPPQDGRPGEIRFDVHRDTAKGIVAQLFDHCYLADFLIFRIFSRIAPDSFGLATLWDIDAEGDQRSVSAKDGQVRHRFKPPTISRRHLTEDEFLELLKDPDSRISYSQLHLVVPCKPQTMKGYLVNAGLAKKGVRLTAQTFAVSELVSDLMPYLRRLEPLGEKAYRLVQLFDVAGLMSWDGID